MEKQKQKDLEGKLFSIQQKLEAPKGQYNSFGKYSYRSAEDILTAVKPLLKEFDCVLTLSDVIKNVGEFNYVKATATLSDMEGVFASVSAYARESVDRKGMDDAQITGATSSYARKYALNGLFAIDDVKDSDNTNNGTPKKKAKKTTSKIVNQEGDDKPWLNSPKIEKARKAIDDSETTLKKILEKYKISRNGQAYLKGEAELEEKVH